MYNLITSISNLLVKVLKSIFLSLDHLLTQIFEIIELKNLNGNNFLLEILIGISIYIVTIFLGTDTDTIDNEKIYRKKYIIMLYAVTILIIIFNVGKFDVYIFTLTILLMMFLNTISGINIGYNLDSLEKELGLFQILTYSSVAWFYKAKTYISMSLLLVLFLFNEYGYLLTKSIDGLSKTSLNYLDEIIMLVIIILFFLLHILIDMKDRFDYYGFKTLSNELVKYIDSEEYKSIFKENISFIEMLGLILYIEDRDFMERKKPTYSFYSVIKRKVSNANLKNIIQRKVDNLANNINNKNSFSEKIKYLVWYIGKVMQKILTKIYFKFKNLTRNFFRGHSTLEQQIVRTTIMKPYTYNYLLEESFL